MMVNDFMNENRPNLEPIYATTQKNPGNRLSWKFFDNLTLLDDQLQEEDRERQVNYADEVLSSEGILMISNPNSYEPSGNRHQTPTIMNSSSTSATTNHQHALHPHHPQSISQHHQQQPQTQQQQHQPHQSGTTNSSGSHTGLLRNEPIHGDSGTSMGGSATHNYSRQGHATGVGNSAATTNTGGDAAFVQTSGFHFGLYGWRKKCLYILILGLMVLIIVNLVLTLWILKVMEFSSEGMGQLKIVAGGIQLSGQALVLDLLRASAIRSRHGQPISIESSRNFSINTRDAEGYIENHLFLGHDRLECLATGFRINDTHGGNLFSVNRNEVAIGAHSLRIDGEGGAIFRESVQTQHVRAEAGRELKLESPTRQLEMSAAQDITLQSRAGSLEISALKEIKLNSLAGSIRLDSSQVLLPNLKSTQPPNPGQPPVHDHNHKIYQLCACYNGKLFLASAHSVCAGDDISVCR